MGMTRVLLKWAGAAALGGVLLMVSGCGQDQAPAPMDPVMASSPSGLWVGETDSGVGLEIQEGGFFKLTRGGQETIGTWKQAGSNAIETTLNGQPFNMPYSRNGLELSITLPGESAPSKFTQM